MGSTPRRPVVLVLDKSSAHRSASLLPNLLNAHMIFLPKNTTSELRPLGPRVIASMTKRYKEQKLNRAVDLLEAGTREIRKSVMCELQKKLVTTYVEDLIQTSSIIVGRKQLFVAMLMASQLNNYAL